MAIDGFGDFLERSAHDLLAHDEVVSLARTMQRGQQALAMLEGTDAEAAHRGQLVSAVRRGEEARDHLILHNLRLVLSITRRYRVQGLTAEDLFQEGVLGLVRAIEKFDPDSGFRLSTYATWWVRQSVERAIADKARIIRLPVHVHERLVKLVRARDDLIRTRGWASFDDLVDATGFQPTTVRELLQLAPGTASLDEVVGDGLTTLGDLQVDPAATDPEHAAVVGVVADEVEKLLTGLSDREADVIRLRFGIGENEPRTLEEIGDRYGVTRERIRQIEARAMRRLRRASGLREPDAPTPSDPDADRRH